MKTEDILNLDCREEQNKNKLNKFLWKIKAVQNLTKRGVEKGALLSVEQLEQVLHGICIRYNYSIQHITTYYEENRFKFYLSSIKRKHEWIGNVYGVTMWEVIAKSLFKIYADVLKEREGK